MATPLEALRLGADVQSYHTCRNQLILKAQETAWCSTDDHPKRVALAADIPQCLQNCCSFRRRANDLSTLLPAELEHRQTINHFPSPPWQLIISQGTSITGRADDIDLKHRCSLTLIASYQADYTIYTDGSASGGTRNGGAAAVVSRGFPVQPEAVTTFKTTGRYQSSPALMRRKQLPWNHL